MGLRNQHREDFEETDTDVLEQKGNLGVYWECLSLQLRIGVPVDA